MNNSAIIFIADKECRFPVARHGSSTTFETGITCNVYAKCRGRTFSEVIRKKHNLKVYENYVQWKLTPHWTVVLAKPLCHDSFRLCRKKIIRSPKEMTL